MVERESHTHVLTEYTPYYPQHLVAETQLIITKAVKKFPTLDLILPLCRYVIARLRLVMMRETSGVRPDLVLMHMDDLLKDMLIEHFRDANTRFHLRQEILTSNEWAGISKGCREEVRSAYAGEAAGSDRTCSATRVDSGKQHSRGVSGLTAGQAGEKTQAQVRTSSSERASLC